MKLFCLFVFLLLFIDVKSQQTQRFYDQNHKITSIDKARYYSVLDYKDSLWIENSYYIGGAKFYMYGRYRDSNCTLPVDTFYYFHMDGSLKEIGKYVNGRKSGQWLSYYSDGMMKDSINYVNGRPVDKSFSWHGNGYLADSTSWTDTGGISISWTIEGIFDAIGYYNFDRKKQGIWKYYHKNGRVSSSEVYENDTLKAIQSFDENGNSIPNSGVQTKVEIESEYPGGATAWNRFLNTTLRMPPYAIDNNIQGNVIVQFIIDTAGNVTEVKALSGDPILKEEAIRVIKKSGKWVPAVSHGRKVKSFKKQPIVFKVEEMIIPAPEGIPQFRPAGRYL